MLKGLRLPFQFLASEFFVRESLTDDLPHSSVESVSVIQRILASSTIVESKLLLIQVTEQVKRFHAHIRSVDATLEETPKILKAVGVYETANILNRVVYYLMRVLRFKAVIRKQRIRV